MDRQSDEVSIWSPEVTSEMSSMILNQLTLGFYLKFLMNKSMHTATDFNAIVLTIASVIFVTPGLLNTVVF